MPSPMTTASLQGVPVQKLEGPYEAETPVSLPSPPGGPGPAFPGKPPIHLSPALDRALLEDNSIPEPAFVTAHFAHGK